MSWLKKIAKTQKKEAFNMEGVEKLKSEEIDWVI
jgi:hypothetical protein